LLSVVDRSLHTLIQSPNSFFWSFYYIPAEVSQLFGFAGELTASTNPEVRPDVLLQPNFSVADQQLFATQPLRLSQLYIAKNAMDALAAKITVHDTVFYVRFVYSDNTTDSTIGPIPILVIIMATMCTFFLCVFCSWCLKRFKLCCFRPYRPVLVAPLRGAQVGRGSTTAANEGGRRSSRHVGTGNWSEAILNAVKAGNLIGPWSQVP
jgi:hypothetical protein